MSYDPPSDTGLVLEELADIKRLLERIAVAAEKDRLVMVNVGPTTNSQFWAHVQAVAANHGIKVGQEIVLGPEALDELASRIGVGKLS